MASGVSRLRSNGIRNVNLRSQSVVTFIATDVTIDSRPRELRLEQKPLKNLDPPSSYIAKHPVAYVRGNSVRPRKAIDSSRASRCFYSMHVCRHPREQVSSAGGMVSPAPGYIQPSLHTSGAKRP
ncbi:hypothetical protein QAD02_002543 [Eretmocerus hayati]|uniref:Uncharacterized protein n=1 Tax=Eretmocerus hayati TaxID=131215 RepID=A0ACC2NLW2_9HYME|nr:hypothetical protein QAD02_002543 [Eretmocerus hayati]